MSRWSGTLVAFASTVLLGAGLAACDGREDEAPPAASDAGPADASMDAAPAPDATPDPSLVHVQVFIEGGAEPKPGTRVFFNDPEGKVVLSGMTDLEGRIAAPLPRGGSVSALYRVDGNAPGHIFTHEDVLPGESIHFGGPVHYDFTEVGRIHVSFTPLPGDVRYTIWTPCKLTSPLSGDSTSPMDAPIIQECVTDTLSVVVTAIDRQTRTVLATSFMDGVPAVPGSTVTMPPFSAPVTLERPVAEVPEETYYISFTEEGDNGLGPTYQSYRQSAQQPVGPLTLEPLVPDGYSARFERQTLTFQKEVSRYSRLERVRDWPPAASEAVDLDALLPMPRDPLFDHDRTFQWRVPPGGEAADYETATILLSLPELSVDIASWSFFVPPGTTKVTLPDLPDELKIYWHPAMYDTDYEVQVLEVDLWDGFHDARAKGQYPWRPEVVLRHTPHELRYSYGYDL